MLKVLRDCQGEAPGWCASRLKAHWLSHPQGCEMSPLRLTHPLSGEQEQCRAWESVGELTPTPKDNPKYWVPSRSKVPNFQKRQRFWTQSLPALLCVNQRRLTLSLHLLNHTNRCWSCTENSLNSSLGTVCTVVNDPWLWLQQFANERDHECYCFPTENWPNYHQWTCCRPNPITSILMFWFPFEQFMVPVVWMLLL